MPRRRPGTRRWAGAAALLLLIAPTAVGIPVGFGGGRGGAARDAAGVAEPAQGADGGGDEGIREEDFKPHFPRHGVDDGGIKEDWESFKALDDNGDSHIELLEWIYHVMGHSPNVEHAKGTLREAVYDKRRGEPGVGDPDDPARDRWEQEFAAADTDRDGKLSYDEYEAMMYHEDPQRPKYLDGHDPAAHRGEDEDHLMKLFDKFDVDRDELLDEEELFQLVQAQHPEDIEGQLEGLAGGEREQLRRQLEGEWLDEAAKFSRYIMYELDQDRDDKLTSVEWAMYEFT